MSTDSRGADLRVAVLMVALLGSCTRPQRQTTEYVGGATTARMSVVNVSPSVKRKIRQASSQLFSERCTEAFVAAKLRSPTELVLADKVVIRLSHDLYNVKPEDAGLLYDETRKAYAWAFSSGRAQGGTVRAATRNGLPLTVDGRHIIFLHPTAFLGESFLARRLSLSGVLAHEFIHAGGQPRTPGLLGVLQDDLAGFPHYGKIMNSCQ